MKTIEKLVWFGLAALLATGTPTEGALILYEGFDYGSTSGPLAGKGAGGGGWAGAWATGMAYSYGGTPSYSANYEPAGLTFSDLPVTGGDALITSNWDGAVSAGRQHIVQATGDLWGSFLYRRTTSPSSPSVAALFAYPGYLIANTYGYFGVQPDMYMYTVGGPRIGGWYGPNVVNSGTATAANVTYLVLFKATNLGATSGTQTMTDWILTEAQYDNFKPGGIMEDELNAASVGPGATQVLQRATDSQTAPLGNRIWAGFWANDYLNFQNYYFGNTVKYDELRISTASFDESLGQVPEPATWIMTVTGALALGAIGLLRRGRRKP